MTDQLVRQGSSAEAEVVRSGGALQTVQTAYATAVRVQKPRDLQQVLKACINEAELAGDLFYYRWETTNKGKKSFLQGASINLALSAIRNFGNMVVQQRPVQETPTSWIFTTAVIDLETGFTLERQFRQDKQWEVFGKFDKYRKDDIRFQIGQSKAMRNAITNVVPAGIIDKMLQAARQSVRTQVETRLKVYNGEIGKVVDELMKGFNKHSVTIDMIERKLDLKADHWDVETLTLLYGDLKAIVSGNETAETLYAEDEQEPASQSQADYDTLSHMSMGNPTTHQGHEAQTVKGVGPLVKEIGILEAERKLPGKLPDVRADHAGAADFAKLTEKQLADYRDWLQTLPAKSDF